MAIESGVIAMNLSNPPIDMAIDVHVRGVQQTWTRDGVDYVVLQKIDLDIPGGEFFSIVGPSGCGKSTLLRIIAGLQPPSSGEVIIGGRLVRQPRTDVGMVFQEASLFPWLTAIDNVAFGPKLAGIESHVRRAQAQEWLSRVGLQDASLLYPHQLSGGMKQRVAIARVLANGARVLLMDEPFAALDYHARRNMQELLGNLWREFRKTVIFVTHHIDEAVLLSDRIALMTPGPEAGISRIVNVSEERPRDPQSEAMQALTRSITLVECSKRKDA